MLDLVRKNVVIIASLALGWSGYSYYDAGSAKAEALAKTDMSGIDPSFLAVRDVSIPLQIANDPYRLAAGLEGAGSQPVAHPAASRAPAASGSASGGGQQPEPKPISQADLLLAFTGALRHVATETRALFADDGASASPAASVGAAAAPPHAGFLLLLQSTVDMRGGGTARINGRTVAQGETMPFLDPVDPPLLLKVRGTAVIVRYDGRDYVADLLENPLLQIGEPAVAAAAPAQAPAASAASATPKATSTAPATGGASGSKVGGKKGTYRVRGSTKKP